MNPQQKKELDDQGKMAFGKHTGSYFDQVSDKYLLWVLENWDWDKLKKFYPYFHKFLMGEYERLQREHYHY